MNSDTGGSKDYEKGGPGVVPLKVCFELLFAEPPHKIKKLIIFKRRGREGSLLISVNYEGEGSFYIENKKTGIIFMMEIVK